MVYHYLCWTWGVGERCLLNQHHSNSLYVSGLLKTVIATYLTFFFALILRSACTSDVDSRWCVRLYLWWHHKVTAPASPNPRWSVVTSLILAHLTLFLSSSVGVALWPARSRGGAGTVLRGAIVLNYTSFQACMNRYLISLEPHQWTTALSSFCFTSCSFRHAQPRLQSSMDNARAHMGAI